MKNRRGTYMMKPSGTRQQLRVIENGLRLTRTSTIKYSLAGQGRGCCALIAVRQHMRRKNAPLCSLVGSGEWRRPTLGGWKKFLREGKEFVGILTTVPVGMVINVGFVTSAQSVQAVIQGSPAGELVLQRKGLLRWVVDPFRSVMLNFEQRGTGIWYHIRICRGHYHSVYSV